MHVVTAPGSIYKGAYSVHEIPHLQRNLNLQHDFLAVREAIKLLQRLQPDILSVHSTKAAYIGRLANRWTRFPVVYTLHGLSYITASTWMKRKAAIWLELLFSRLTTSYVFLSKSDANILKAIPSSKRTIIANGTRQLEVSNELNIPNQDCPRILWVGRLSSPKDPLRLLNDLAEVQHLEWHLDIVGEGALEEPVRKKIDDFNWNERVTLHGQVLDPGPLYKQASFVVLSSKAEGQPLVILEAMAHGKAVVASDVGAIRELVDEGVTGYLVYHSFTPYVKYLLKHPEVAQQMGSAALQRHRNHFTLDNMLGKTVAHYEELRKPR